MLTSLYNGISGMSANSTALGVIGDNIANLNTTGFKGSRIEFGDVLSQNLNGVSGSSQVGRGVKVERVATKFSQGSFETTNNALDLAIDGNGFFIVNNGAVSSYTRAGQFSLDKTGKVVNTQGYALQGYQADVSGTITGTLGDLNFSNKQNPAHATTKATVAVNLNASETAQTTAFTLDGNADGNANDPANYNASSSIKVYDSLGGAHDVTMYFCKTGPGAWTVHYVNTDPTDATKLVESGTQALSFGTNGSLIDDGSTTPVSFDFGTDVVTPQDILFDYGTGTGETPAGTGFDGTTQFGSPFSVLQQIQDGYGSGGATNISISDSGIISASFTNGQTRTIGQLALASFSDPSNLNKLGNSLYQETYNSGQPLIGKPETSGVGRILSNTLELSNVDLASEFVRLITAQRAFQASSRVITTSDEILQELINIKR